MSAELYEGWVRHRRYGEVNRSFRHRVFMTLSGGRRRTLEMPCSLGVGFNPVRFHFDMDGDEVASLAEVTNTPWGERHTYEFEGRAGRAEKVLRVPPFLDMDHEYVCHASRPGPHITVHVENLRAGPARLRRHALARAGPATRPAAAADPLPGADAAGAGADLRPRRAPRRKRCGKPNHRPPRATLASRQ